MNLKRRCINPAAYLVKSPMRRFNANNHKKVELTAFTAREERLQTIHKRL